MSKEQEKFVIFGNPVAHSKSPQMQNAGFESLDYNGIYEKHQLLDGNTIKETFLQNNYEGANITVPHKEFAYKNADEVRGLAQRIKAVNTYINENGKVIAYNTDAPGFLKAIESFGKVKSVLLLGAGGTAKAIALALQENNIEVTVLNRSEGKLEFFKNEGINCYSWEDFEKEVKEKEFDLIVNSTSAGLKDEYLPCDKELLQTLFKSAKYAFDCVYGKITPFLALAKENGLEIKDGEDMLLYQGVLAFEYFTKQKVDEKVSEAMRKGLKKE
ncbi:shikimate dehydrogenase [Poseidonibacter antarcticus]|uniref:shikimate dehydrogenase n=1 Tax=Poseidonibacter antarcticus TaxID=2478538 RepID=UPI000EF513FD|nr:shikimate dehydrogenase [Poseidonibacter antarcticus]